MPMQADEIADFIKSAIPDAEVIIKDLAGDGDHYAAHVTSAAFAGASRELSRSLKRTGACPPSFLTKPRISWPSCASIRNDENNSVFQQ